MIAIFPCLAHFLRTRNQASGKREIPALAGRMAPLLTARRASGAGRSVCELLPAGMRTRLKARQGRAASHRRYVAYIRPMALPGVSKKPDITKVCRILQKCHLPGRAPSRVSLLYKKII